MCQMSFRSEMRFFSGFTKTNIMTKYYVQLAKGLHNHQFVSHEIIQKQHLKCFRVFYICIIE